MCTNYFEFGGRWTPLNASGRWRFNLADNVHRTVLQHLMSLKHHDKTEKACCPDTSQNQDSSPVRNATLNGLPYQ
ncbi:unnamed protein product, partial [Discosporangium mesarthrocarpum]